MTPYGSYQEVRSKQIIWPLFVCFLLISAEYAGRRCFGGSRAAYSSGAEMFIAEQIVTTAGNATNMVALLCQLLGCMPAPGWCGNVINVFTRTACVCVCVCCLLYTSRCV